MTLTTRKAGAGMLKAEEAVMKKARWQIGILALTLGAVATLGQKTTAEALFREALMKERAEGNLREAIFRYERVIADFPNDKQFAARAMYQLSQIYEKLRDPRARVMLTRLSGTGVAPYAGRARARLAEQTSTPPGPFAEVKLDENYELGSPDGKYVVYHKEPDQKPDQVRFPGTNMGRLYLKDLATGKERLLLDSPGDSVSFLAWSPDSRKLAYNFAGAEPKVDEIRILDVANGEVVSLGISGVPSSWTDTEEIFFGRLNLSPGGIDYFLVPATGGTPRKVHSDSGCCTVVAPDGKRMIQLKSGRLYLVDMASGEQRPITTGTGEERGAALSPDGRMVAFAANDEGNWAFYLAPLDQELPVKKPVKVANVADPGYALGGWPSRSWWTHDGLLTFGIAESAANLYRVDMDPSTGRAIDSPRRLTQDAPRNQLPAISPDGRHVAYWYNKGISYGLAVMDSDGRNERPLFDQDVVLELGWRSPEKILFYHAKPKEGEKSSIHALNMNTGVLEPIAELEGLYWQYVPSRKEILHWYPGGGDSRAGAPLKAFSLATRKDRVVATIDYLAPTGLAVSFDGKRIAYTTARPVEGSNQRLHGLSLMSIDGEAKTNLIPPQSEWLWGASAWSPDGKYLLYIAESGPRIMNVETRESWALHSELAEANWGGASWSPDGTFIVINKSEFSRWSRLAWEGVTYEAVTRLLAAK